MSLQVTELDHAVVHHHLSRLRSVDTSPATFRLHTRVLATLLLAEVTRDLPTQSCEVKTPLEVTPGREIMGRIAAVPILRAGLGMVEPICDLIPEAEVWHLGLYRDEETAEPVHYYDKLPDDRPVSCGLVLDPMLATGGSALAAIGRLKEWGVPDIRMLSIIAAPEGVARLNTECPDVPVYTCALDRELNSKNYICPGLGDAGDRIFNTIPE